MSHQKKRIIALILVSLLIASLFYRHLTVRKYARMLEAYSQINLSSWVEDQTVALNILNQRLLLAESDDEVVRLLDEWYNSIAACAEADLLYTNLRSLYERNRNGNIATVSCVDRIINNNHEYSEILQWFYDELDLGTSSSHLSFKFVPLSQDSKFHQELADRLNEFAQE